MIYILNYVNIFIFCFISLFKAVEYSFKKTIRLVIINKYVNLYFKNFYLNFLKKVKLKKLSNILLRKQISFRKKKSL